MDGTLDMSIIAPAHYAIVAEKYGFRYLDIKQELDRITLFPSCYVSGSIIEDSKHAFAVHCCTHSWANMSIFHKISQYIKNNVFYIKALFYNA